MELVPFPPYLKTLLFIMGEFIRFKLHEQEGKLDPGVILSIDLDEWIRFRICPRSMMQPPVPSPQHPANPSYAQNMELQSFLKAIKRDKTQYPELKDDRQFDNWHRSFIAIARSHRIEDVLNPDYKSTGDHKQELFNEKQKFLYTVFDACLKTDMGKTLVLELF